MPPPHDDLADRRPVWDILQMFWMDTDPNLFLADAARICAASKYTLDEVGQIYWNEVRPAVEFNLQSIAGEWTGFDLDWLTNRILEVHCSGAPRSADRYAQAWWNKLRDAITDASAV